MNRFLLLCCLFIFQPFLIAVEISVDTTRLSIPAPEGYSAITSDMQPYAGFSKRFVPASNEQFAMFVSPADAAAAARGEIPQPERWFCVQTTKRMIPLFASTAEFGQLKQTIKTQNEKILEEVKSQLPDFFQKVNKGISNDYNVDLSLSLDQMVPLPAHYESARGLAYSALLKYKITDEGGKPSTFEGAVTATLVHLKGKVLFLYSYAEKPALPWSRAESQKWADAIIAANPSTGNVAVRESKPARSGFDWGRVFSRALAGGVAGGVIGALAFLLRKKKSKPPSQTS